MNGDMEDYKEGRRRGERERERGNAILLTCLLDRLWLVFSVQ